jgi:hypothetical protein
MSGTNKCRTSSNIGATLLYLQSLPHASGLVSPVLRHLNNARLLQRPRAPRRYGDHRHNPATIPPFNRERLIPGATLFRGDVFTLGAARGVGLLLRSREAVNPP